MIPALIVIGTLLVLYGLLFLDSFRFKVRHAEISHAQVNRKFTLVQVSDLHDRRFGRGQEKLLAAIRESKPDLIIVTGDLFNRHRPSACRNAFAFIDGAVKVAPVCFAEGNHEAALKETGERYIETIRKMGVAVLRDEFVDFKVFRLIGLKQYASADTLASMLCRDRLNVVLAHRPERFPIYAQTGADVILSGHAHGGQVRLFGHGLFAPQQGLFPKYTSGLYLEDRSLLFVSKGLGNTIPIPRVFNTPECNVLTFVPSDQKGDNDVCERG